MISLSDYIKRRNGVPLGHSKSLENMLKRSLGAKSFDLFWVYWNPIWNYYLTKYIYKPLNKLTQKYIAVVFTFAVSGFIHDVVGFLIYKKMSLFITIWFAIMGIVVIASKKIRLEYSSQNRAFNCCCNILFIVFSFLVTKLIF